MSRPFSRKVGTGTIPLYKRKTPPPESINWWWHPDRPGVWSGPVWFKRRLAEVDPNLRLTYNAYDHEWLIWNRAPRINHKLCQGWLLLFPEKGRLDELEPHIIARLYEASGRKWGSAKNYFEAIQREQATTKAREHSRYMNDLHAEADDWFDHSQIRVGYGRSRGDKFSTYLA